VAFLALGLALRSGRAVPVVCTSGTAAANLHPAVLEAAHAGVPLLALTDDLAARADSGTGANQTVSSPACSARPPRLELSLGVARRAAGQQAGWRASVAKAVAVAVGRVGGRPGPVHVNVPFAEPLMPDDPSATDPADRGWATRRIGPTRRTGQSRWTAALAPRRGRSFLHPPTSSGTPRHCR